MPVDMARKAEELKKDLFYDKPYSEMYRYLIQLGMDEIQEQAAEQMRCEGVS